ncbi:hypothetical protein [Klebsiella michiganensis]|uniref:hypothetical protein n=1 Tax=Klebsiella michiganensis TaxID=1134687 RepID=UPI00351A3D57
MNISTVNELIQSLESAGELSIREQKFLKLAKAYQQLAAENVALALENVAMKQIVDSVTNLDNEPQYHAEGMGCGLEDRGITDRYDACRYGWDEAMEQIYGEVIPCAEELDFPATDRIVAGIKADEAKFIFQSILDNPAVTDLGSLVDWLEQHANDSAAAVRAMREGADK